MIHIGSEDLNSAYEMTGQQWLLQWPTLFGDFMMMIVLRYWWQKHFSVQWIVPQLLNRAQHLKVVTNTFRHQYRCCQIWPTFAIHRKQPYARKNQTVFYIMWRCIRSLGCNFHFEIYNFYYVENYNSRRPHGIFLFEYTEWIHVKFWAAIFMFLYFSKSFFN